MSAIKKEIVSVAVTGGDAIETNRLTGKSNTGTYFVSSIKNFGNFQDYFDSANTFEYELDLKKLQIYKQLFINNFFERRNAYLDKMKDFESTCDRLLLAMKNPKIKFTLRINDTRVFLKFFDNNGKIESMIRKIIYSDLTILTFEKNAQHSVFSLDINQDQLLDKEEEEIVYDFYE